MTYISDTCDNDCFNCYYYGSVSCKKTKGYWKEWEWFKSGRDRNECKGDEITSSNKNMLGVRS